MKPEDQDDSVHVFFYGSFMNREVLSEVDLVPRNVQVAVLHDFDIRIAPLATVVRAPGKHVYGIVCEAPLAALERLYGQDWVGTYSPEDVRVEIEDGSTISAWCYAAHDMAPSPADDDYVDRIVGPAREFDFPKSYLERLESFRPPRRTE